MRATRSRAVTPPPTTSVADAFARARQHGERAAILEHIVGCVGTIFTAPSGEPEQVLQRSGEGPREASIDAIVDVTGLLLELVAKEKQDFDRLLLAAVELEPASGGGEGTSLEELRDHVVPNPKRSMGMHAPRRREPTPSGEI